MSEDDHKEMKFLLGDYGLSIISAISSGASTFETIKIMSGVPLSCIRGRIPVLLELGLIKKEDNEYSLTEKGLNLKKRLKKY
ncbi:MAG: hypothetical protein EU547_00290 [Promethearchaeota archaeon]|nr:MAG: hypothetical protein EU547_00290 [Candidatus Lokiarchaeota archaeon]